MSSQVSPFTPKSDSISDFETLTPNHFLLGTKVTNYALGSFNDCEVRCHKNGELFKRH